MLLSEVGKVEKWKQHCMVTLGSLIGDENSLLGALQKVWMQIPQLSNFVFVSVILVNYIFFCRKIL